MKPQTEVQHTPTPWKVLPGLYDGECKIVMDDKRWANPHQGYVMTCGNDQQANAAYIVRACNHFEKLQAAMKEAAKYIPSGTTPYNLLWDAIEEASK